MTRPKTLALIRSGQQGKVRNTSALKSGIWTDLRRLDRRTKASRLMESLEALLVEDVRRKNRGLEPSPQQRIILGRATFKFVRCCLYEGRALEGDQHPASDSYYLSWSNSLREDLKLLGIEPVPAPTQTLSQFLEQRRREIAETQQNATTTERPDDTAATRPGGNQAEEATNGTRTATPPTPQSTAAGTNPTTRCGDDVVKNSAKPRVEDEGDDGIIWRTRDR